MLFAPSYGLTAMATGVSRMCATSSCCATFTRIGIVGRYAKRTDCGRSGWRTTSGAMLCFAKRNVMVGEHATVKNSSLRVMLVEL